MRELVSTGEAARHLGVSPATIQRWVDAGVVSAVRTHGGHRRIPLSEVRRTLAAKRPLHLEEPVANWMKVLLTGDPFAVRTAMLSAHRRTCAWSAVAEEISAAFAEVGRLWEIGSCQIFEEHAASEALHRAAALCVLAKRPDRTAKNALLLSAAGDLHTLGLSLAELVTIEAGWNAQWLGEGPPTEELDLLIESRKPQLLIASASSASTRQAIEDYQSALEAVAARHRVRLVLAGGGPWKQSRVADRIESFTELAQVLVVGSRRALRSSKQQIKTRGHRTTRTG
ncbi:MAG: helix-turn-helix domain-containing protein [Hyphomicrobium sp.]